MSKNTRNILEKFSQLMRNSSLGFCRSYRQLISYAHYVKKTLKRDANASV